MTRINPNYYIGNTNKTIGSISTTQTIEITTNYNCIKVHRYGNIVSIDIDGNIQESSGIIATNLPRAVFSYTYIKGLYGNDYLRVSDLGKLYINSHTAGEWANIHGTYICND